MNMILILALCSFVACLPTVLGISCYSCHEYLGSNQTCSNPSTSSCASYYDSCMTLRVTAQFMGLNISQTLKDCAISSTCSSTVLCDQVNSTISGTGITMLSCTLDCCSGDLCNGQASAKKRSNKRRLAGPLLMKNALATVKESLANLKTKKRRMS
ncbi:hypothetical protein ABFA07_015121 [Porites harrisoni]